MPRKKRGLPLRDKLKDAIIELPNEDADYILQWLAMLTSVRKEEEKRLAKKKEAGLLK